MRDCSRNPFLCFDPPLVERQAQRNTKKIDAESPTASRHKRDGDTPIAISDLGFLSYYFIATFKFVKVYRFPANYQQKIRSFLYLCTHFGGFRNKVLKNKSLTTLKTPFPLYFDWFILGYKDYHYVKRHKTRRVRRSSIGLGKS